MLQPLRELGGDLKASVLHIAVANGFPPETYIPLLRPFFDDYRVISLPPRALWGDEAPPNAYTDTGWSGLTDDMLKGIQQYHLDGMIAVGHSFGGVVSLLATIQQPERFRALVLLDPTILPPPGLEIIKQARENHLVDSMPLVQGAMRRRRQFESVEAAYIYFRSKSFFAPWSDETLHFYTEGGTKPTSDGVKLAWSPEWEAYYFASVHTTIWEDLTNLSPKIPLLILRGGDSDTFFPEAEDMVRKLLPHATYGSMDGHGHLFPQTAADETARMIQQWLADKLPTL